jgi:hypothetical protein
MSARAMLWIGIGLAAGVMHATSLWRSAREYQTRGWGAVWRLPVVAGVLVVAALARALLSAVVGWLIGLSATSVATLVRTRQWM